MLDVRIQIRDLGALVGDTSKVALRYKRPGRRLWICGICHKRIAVRKNGFSKPFLRVEAWLANTHYTTSTDTITRTTTITGSLHVCPICLYTVAAPKLIGLTTLNLPLDDPKCTDLVEELSDTMAENIVIELRQRKRPRRPYEPLDIERYVLRDENNCLYGLKATDPKTFHGRRDLVYILRPDVLAALPMEYLDAFPDYTPALLHVPYDASFVAGVKPLEVILFYYIFEDYMQRYGLGWKRCRFFMSSAEFRMRRESNVDFVFRNYAAMLKQLFSVACPLRLKVARRFPLSTRYSVYRLLCRHENYIRLAIEAPLLMGKMAQSFMHPSVWNELDIAIQQGVAPHEVVRIFNSRYMDIKLHPVLIDRGLIYNLDYPEPLAWVSSVSGLKQRRLLIGGLNSYRHVYMNRTYAANPATPAWHQTFNPNEPFWVWLKNWAMSEEAKKAALRKIWNDVWIIVDFIYSAQTQTSRPKAKRLETYLHKHPQASMAEVLTYIAYLKQDGGDK